MINNRLHLFRISIKDTSYEYVDSFPNWDTFRKYRHQYEDCYIYFPSNTIISQWWLADETPFLTDLVPDEIRAMALLLT